MTPSPYIIDEPDSFLNPIDVNANNTYVGVYALDTFNATDRLTLTGGARFNFAGISLEGTNDALLSGYSDYFHLNPTVGLTYKITPDINFYARICDDQSHADAARARLRQPHLPLHHRQLPVRRPAAQAGRRQDVRAGLPWAERSCPIGVPNGAS